MSSEISDEIVIKKKRRRRAAVDPCLGYYRNDPDAKSSDAPAIPYCTASKKEEIQVLHDDALQENGKQQNVDLVSSDYAQAVTSPLQDHEDVASAAAAITVEDFLRQQASANANTPRRRFRKTKTYSCKRRRRVQFSGSSEDEGDDDDDMADLPVLNNASTRIIETSSSPRIITRRARKAKQRQERKASRASTARKRKSGDAGTSRTTFSKRIQRAALLSSVDPDLDMDFDCTPMMPAPLRLVTRDQIPPRSPSTPMRDKRAKLVNPCIPRPIDTSFAFENKENAPLTSVQVPNKKKKGYKPFLQWSRPPGSFPQIVPRTPVSSPLASKSFRNRSMRLGNSNPTSIKMITPLQLVPYEKHDRARSAKFDKSSLRRLSRMRTARVEASVLIPIPPLILRSSHRNSASACASTSVPLVPATAVANAEDDPFESLPISLPLTLTLGAELSSRVAAAASTAPTSSAFQPDGLNVQDNEKDCDSVKQTPASSFLSRFPEVEVLVPQTSEFESDSACSPAPAPDETLETFQKTCASDSSGASNDVNAITSPDLERPYSASTPAASTRANDVLLSRFHSSPRPDCVPKKDVQQTRSKTELAQNQTQAQVQTRTRIRTPRPMRRIGTMLDGLRERARSVLLTQTQAEPQRQRQHRHLSRLPSIAALPLESTATETRTRTQAVTGSAVAALSYANTQQGPDFDLDSDRDLILTRRTRRASSRRLVFSSPIRYSDRRLIPMPASMPAPIPAFTAPSMMARFSCTGPGIGVDVGPDGDAATPGRDAAARERAGGAGDTTESDNEDGDENEDESKRSGTGLSGSTKTRELGFARMRSVSTFLGQIFEDEDEDKREGGETDEDQDRTEQGESQRRAIRSSPWLRPLPVPVSTSESLSVPRRFPASVPRSRALVRSQSRFPSRHADANANARPPPCSSSMIQTNKQTTSTTTSLVSAASTTDKLPPLPSLLFDYHNGLAPLNLLDLLEDTEPQRAGAQIILSPSS